MDGAIKLVAQALCGSGELGQSFCNRCDPRIPDPDAPAHRCAKRGNNYGPDCQDWVMYRGAAEEALRPLAPLFSALDNIASWGEGAEVRPSFDYPSGARTARQALAAVGILGPLRSEEEGGTGT